LNTHIHGTLIILLFALLFTANTKTQNFTKPDLHIASGKLQHKEFYADTLKKNLVTKRSISALFIGLGGGIGIPNAKFSETANPVFGILGRLEFSSTGIFPFVIGGEVNYYSFNSPDEFRTVNLLSSYRTKILAFGLNIDYSLSKLMRSSFTMPFISVDVKSNNIKRDYDVDTTFTAYPKTDSKISIGAGVGFTVFIFDFTVKYNYMKDNSFVAVTAKTKFPIIRF